MAINNGTDQWSFWKWSAFLLVTQRQTYWYYLSNFNWTIIRCKSIKYSHFSLHIIFKLALSYFLSHFIFFTTCHHCFCSRTITLLFVRWDDLYHLPFPFFPILTFDISIFTCFPSPHLNFGHTFELATQYIYAY